MMHKWSIALMMHKWSIALMMHKWSIALMMHKWSIALICISSVAADILFPHTFFIRRTLSFSGVIDLLTYKN